jgi:hypothetical protein
MRQPIDKSKYILTFLITAIIFGSLLYVDRVLVQKRFGDIQAVQDQISLDLLSSETQFDLLKDASCKTLDGSILSQELNSLATKLSYLESSDTGKQSDELIYLKKYYSLLEIKDSLLMKQLGEKCKEKAISILYFYGNKEDCTECEDMSYVLTYLRQNYPELRIYSFDTNLDLSAIDTLNSVYKIDSTKLPAIVYDDQTHVGFRSIEEMKELIPELKKIDEDRLKGENASSTTAASSTTGSTSGTQNSR